MVETLVIVSSFFIRGEVVFLPFRTSYIRRHENIAMAQTYKASRHDRFTFPSAELCLMIMKQLDPKSLTTAFTVSGLWSLSASTETL